MSQLDLALAIGQAETGSADFINASDPVDQLNSLSQLIAGLTTLATSTDAALYMVAANAGAALVTASKIELDLNQK